MYRKKKNPVCIGFVTAVLAQLQASTRSLGSYPPWIREGNVFNSSSMTNIFSWKVYPINASLSKGVLDMQVLIIWKYWLFPLCGC